jgi:hypothetical protein
MRPCRTRIRDITAVGQISVSAGVFGVLQQLNPMTAVLHVKLIVAQLLRKFIEINGKPTC